MSQVSEKSIEIRTVYGANLIRWCIAVWCNDKLLPDVRQHLPKSASIDSFSWYEI